MVSKGRFEAVRTLLWPWPNLCSLTPAIQAISGTNRQDKANGDGYKTDKKGFSVGGRWMVLADPVDPVKGGAGTDL